MLTSFFVNPGMLAGVALVGLPIVIHLIHRFRTRRIRWAAIDFLLESERRNRRRLLLEQLLLLALRCLLVVLIVAILARPRLDQDLSGLFTGQQSTEHVLLLDDSYSMSEQTGPQSLFDRSRDVLIEIAQKIAEQGSNHRITLLRTSRPDQTPEWASVAVDAATPHRLRSLCDSWTPSFSGISPAESLPRIFRLLDQSDAPEKVVYLISDFRSRDWERGEMADQMREEAGDFSYRLIDVAGPASVNVGVESLDTQLSAVAVGTPFTVTVRLRNHSDRPLSNVSVEPFVDKQPLPTRVLESLPAAGVGEVEFQARIATEGVHDIGVRIDQDVINADNFRGMSVNLSQRNRVLIVDDSPERSAAKYLSLALSPGGPAKTGLAPETHGSERLTSGPIDEYRVVYIAAVSSISQAGLRVLKQYVEKGGGLALFLGDLFDPRSVTQWSGEAPALLPIAPGTPVDIESGTDAPPWQVDLTHPAFAIFAGDRNPFLQTVRFNRCLSLGDAEKQGESVKVVARTAAGQPLALDWPAGRGRVFCLLSSCSPQWNNWCRNPSFVVSMLELNAYLSEPSIPPTSELVGEKWSDEYELTAFRRRVEFSLPTVTGGDPQKLVLEGELQGSRCSIQFRQTEVPGPYRLTKSTVDGTPVTQGRFFNVDPAEGDLRRISEDQLRQSLAGVDFEYLAAENIGGSLSEPRLEPRNGLLALFVLFLFAEQWLAWRLSYHLS